MRRILIYPLDTLKTMQQVQGKDAGQILKWKAKSSGVASLWAGATGGLAAQILSAYPWWATLNMMERSWPRPSSVRAEICYDGAIGICASVVADCCANPLRVLKTVCQTHQNPHIGYSEAARDIIEKVGLLSLFCRGLP